MKIKKIALIAVLIALSVVLSTWLKIPLISDIKLDLSYIVLTVAVAYCGMGGSMLIGGLSAFLGSLLFSAYGISISWILSNIVIAIIASLFYKSGKNLLFVIGIIVACAVGLLGVKTLIECVLYHIPLGVKIAKNAVAFLSDCACMLLGVPVVMLLKKHFK